MKTPPPVRPAVESEPARWQRLQQLFHEALALAEAPRAAFVEAACADDPVLRAELQRLLAAAAAADTPISQAIGAAAAQWVAAAVQARIGQRLGPWRLTAHHADGGMGAVYRAERDDGRYTQQVAVKLLNPAYAGTQARARLEAERRILARLEHPHIARLLDAGSTDDGVPYLVMEFVDGEPIDAWCDRHGADTATRLRLFAQVCRAVDHAHRCLVVHRDLKPSNILVDTEGRPRLLDFGIARLLDEASGVTRTGERVLTPSHASPEQITGGVVTTATDVYALGVLLYDLLAGKPPYGGADTPAATLARQIVETEPPRPSSAVADTRGVSSRRLARLHERGEHLTPQRLARELEGDLDNIVLMALRKEPERRYATAAALADDVERFLAQRPVRARPDTLGYRSSKFVRRHRVAVPVSALALLLALGGAASFTWRVTQERDRALAAEASARAAEARARRAADFTASVLENTGANREAARQVSVSTLLEQAAARVDQELGDEPEVAMRMRIAIGAALHSWGSYDAAMKELTQALDDARRRGAEGERDQAETMRLLGTVTHDLGQLELSLDWARQAAALYRRVGDAGEHAAALLDLALGLNGVRRRAEAQPVFREALARMRQAHPGDHDDTAWLLNNMAWGLHAMGRFDEAAPLYEEAVAMQRRLGAALVDLGQTQSNLAGLYFDRGDLGAAEDLWTQVLAQYESVFGQDGHAAVARSQGLVAMVAIERGEVALALQMAQASLATQTRLVGEHHRWTARAMHGYARALLAAGRLDEAERWLRRARATLDPLVSARHAERVGHHLTGARIALARGTPAELKRAERELRAGLARIAALPSPDRVPRDAMELALAQALARQGRRDEGRAVAEAALARMRQTLPAGHWRRLLAEAAIGLPPLQAAATPEAVALARQTLVTLRERTGPEAPAVHELEQSLAMVR